MAPRCTTRPYSGRTWPERGSRTSPPPTPTAGRTSFRSSFALEGDTLYTAVDAKPKRSRTLRRMENARRRPQVTVLVDRYDEDWSRLWWVRLRGLARVLDAGEEAERALELLIEKYEQYRAAAPTTPVLAIDVEEWRGWSSGGQAWRGGAAGRQSTR